jgi:hypothetical protein
MGYYPIPLDFEAQKCCTIMLPWGKYQYKRLPMGVKTSQDIFQRIIYELLGDIPNIQVYLDDILFYKQFRVSRTIKQSTPSGSYCRQIQGQLTPIWVEDLWDIWDSLSQMHRTL